MSQSARRPFIRSDVASNRVPLFVFAHQNNVLVAVETFPSQHYRHRMSHFIVRGIYVHSADRTFPYTVAPTVCTRRLVRSFSRDVGLLLEFLTAPHKSSAVAIQKSNRADSMPLINPHDNPVGQDPHIVELAFLIDECTGIGNPTCLQRAPLSRCCTDDLERESVGAER